MLTPPIVRFTFTSAQLQVLSKKLRQDGPEIIQSTVAGIKSMKPDYIVPTHCTGFEANVAFSREMPNEFVLNTACSSPEKVYTWLSCF